VHDAAAADDGTPRSFSVPARCPAARQPPTAGAGWNPLAHAPEALRAGCAAGRRAVRPLASAPLPRASGPAESIFWIRSTFASISIPEISSRVILLVRLDPVPDPFYRPREAAPFLCGMGGLAAFHTSPHQGPLRQFSTNFGTPSGGLSSMWRILVVPASLFSRLRADRAEGTPLAKVSIGDHRSRTGHSLFPQIPRDPAPDPGGFPMPRGHRHYDLQAVPRLSCFRVLFTPKEGHATYPSRWRSTPREVTGRTAYDPRGPCTRLSPAGDSAETADRSEGRGLQRQQALYWFARCAIPAQYTRHAGPTQYLWGRLHNTDDKAGGAPDPWANRGWQPLEHPTRGSPVSKATAGAVDAGSSDHEMQVRIIVPATAVGRPRQASRPRWSSRCRRRGDGDAAIRSCGMPGCRDPVEA